MSQDNITNTTLNTLNSNTINFSDELKQSYLDYSMSVIVNRAIPDVRDGCKPVQRRILFSMWENGYFVNKPYKKCAKIIGDVLGRYHPHGESAIYDAMVRMAQDFVMNQTLIDGQGNFGSIDGDSAASTRYTEARLTKIAQYMLNDINRDVVDMIPNYDNSLEMPSILPAAFPNILVNGASGIAVGMATLIPPHNLDEVIDAVCMLIDNPEASIHQLTQIIKGPDFPTGGVINASSDMTKIYETGRGHFYIRGILEASDRTIIITHIPYQVNKSRLIEQLVDLSENQELLISAVRDESNCDGIRIVIELKKHANTDFVVDYIYNKTQMQVAFHANVLAIHNGVPMQMNVREILDAFLKFREEVLIRRSTHLINHARARCHILYGLLLAVAKLDEIISMVKASKSIEDARNALMSIFWDRNAIQPYLDRIGYKLDAETQLSEVQVKAILEMRLQSLTNLENQKIMTEFEELLSRINDLALILNDRNHRLSLIKKELTEIKAAFPSPRRTEISAFAQNDDKTLIQIEDCVITCSQRGYVKRVKLNEYKLQKRGGVGKRGLSDADIVTHILIANTHQDLLIFLSSGYVHSIPAHTIPAGDPSSVGRSLLNILPIDKDVSVTAIVPISENETQDTNLVFVTSSGYVRKNDIKDFSGIRKNGKIAIKLDDNEKLCSVVQMVEDDELFITSSAGRSVRLSILEIRTFMSRTSKGVIGMSLGDDERIISVCKISKNSDSQYILSVTERGFGKRTKISNYRSTKRGAKGVTTTIIDAETGPVVGAHAVGDDGEVMLINNSNQIIRFAISDVRIANRVTKGVKLLKLSETDSKIMVSFYHGHAILNI